MATTTNYGWTTPDDTALVKDGASAIRTLGSSIDTSLNTALGTKKAGLVLLNTTSFSGVSSQSFNNVFSATYTHYRVLFHAVNSGDSGANFRFRVAGSDATSGDYFVQKNYITNGLNPSKTGATSATTIDLGPLWTGFNSYSYDIFNPFVTTRSQIIGNSFSLNSFSSWEALTTFALLNTATSYDGFTFYPLSGTMTGNVSVYGYNK